MAVTVVWFVAAAVLSLAGCGTTMGEAGSPMRPGALYYNFSAPRSGDPGFWNQVQRVYANRICTSLPSSLRIAWKGVLKPRHFLGVRLAVMTMS